MSITRGTDKEVMAHTYNGLLLSHKKEQTCGICKDVGRPRDCHKSEVSQKEKNVISLICGIQKNGTDECIFRAERKSQIQRTNVWTRRETGGWGGMNWAVGIDTAMDTVYTLPCTQQETNETLLHSTGDWTQLCGDVNGKEIQGKGIYYP